MCAYVAQNKHTILVDCFEPPDHFVLRSGFLVFWEKRGINVEAFFIYLFLYRIVGTPGIHIREVRSPWGGIRRP